MFTNVTAVDPNFMMQTLGAIVQAYASLLALGGAFYIFLIERINTQFEETEEKLDLLLIEANRHHGSAGFSFLDMKEKGLSHFEDHYGDNRGHILYLKEQSEIEDIFYFQPKYETLKKKRGHWTFRHFSTFLLFCIMTLITSLGYMFLLTTGNFIQSSSHLGFTLIVLLSLSGFLYFLKTCRDLAKIENEPEEE